MNFSLPQHMMDATRLTRSGNLMEATAALQRALRPGSDAPGAATEMDTLTIEGVAVDLTERRPDNVGGNGAFLARTYNGTTGSRPYRLYVPSGYHGQALPLVVMLHGCTQSPEDFAAGTRMNEVAEAQNILVAYPSQLSSANVQKCWNWFRCGDQRRDAGEPALIAGIAREVMAEMAVDRRRVFIAGLSAGGAAAAIMGQAYPDLFAAIGVHSGLACGAARDMGSAFAAMQGNGAAPSGGCRAVPTIIFHGDSDRTVSVGNADHVAAQSAGAASATRVERGHSADGTAYTRTLYLNRQGGAVVEKWLPKGLVHAGARPGRHA
eukprot:gene5825-5890_t